MNNEYNGWKNPESWIGELGGFYFRFDVSSEFCILIMMFKSCDECEHMDLHYDFKCNHPKSFARSVAEITCRNDR
jgi:hypothetical protein